MGPAQLGADISILRSKPGKLYKPVTLCPGFALKVLHRVTFGGSALLNGIHM